MKPQTQANTIIEDADASIKFDFQYYPILVSWWHGQTTMGLADRNFETRAPYIEQAAAEGRKVIMITDLSQMKAPPATVRKRIAELAKESDMNPGFYGYMVIVPNAVLRGMVTALTWLIGDSLAPVHYASTLPEAVMKSAEVLRQQGFDVPAITFDPTQV